MHVILKKITRELIKLLMFFFPPAKKIAVERWLRGKEEQRKLDKADCVVVSYGKSGRTWLRVMLSGFFQVKHNLSENSLIGFDNLHRMNADVPTIFFTHDNYLKDYTKHRDTKEDFYHTKVVLLVRDPRDVAVSQFFQWKYRMRKAKKIINNYPLDDEVSTFDFIMNENVGLPKIIEFMNLWERELPNLNNVLVVRYEDMRRDAAQVLRQIVEFMGTPGDDEQVKAAVDYASYENMKKMEEKQVFWLSGGRMVPGDRSNPHSYKVRRAKVGGYRDYFNDEQVAQIEQLVNTRLAPSFGYSGTAKPDVEQAVGA